MSSYTLSHNGPQNRPALIRPQENCVQTKLEIGISDDPNEKVADSVADRIMMMPVTPIAVDADDEEELQMQPNEEEEKVLQMQHQAPAIRMKCDECEEEEKIQMNPTPSIQLQNDGSANEGSSPEANTSETEGESPNIRIDMPRPLNIRVNGVMYTSPTFLLEGPNGSLVDLAPYTGSGFIDFPLAALESLGIPILSFYHFHFGRARQYLGQDFESAFGLSGGTSFIRNAIHYGYISAGHIELYGAPSSYRPEHYEGLPDLNIVANPMDIGTMINVSYFNNPLGPHENNPTVLFTLTVPFDQNPFEAVTNLGGALYHALSGDLYDLPDVTHNYPGFRSRPNREIGSPSTRTRISPKMSKTGHKQVTSEIEQQITSKKNQGHTLPSGVQKFMEGRFGTDFRDVNVHTGSESIRMNQQLGSKAFTVGQDIHFNSGEYTPRSSEGKRLLAHELTHVIQQRKAQPDNHSGIATPIIQRITCRSTSGRQPSRVPQGQPNRLDARANRILSIASNSDYSNQQKAVRLITAIICHYYNPQAAKVHSIHYDADLSSGLRTQSVGRGTNVKGKIFVSSQFIRDTTARHFARRVLQVGHELQHIDQYRQGLTGSNNQNEREFLAFYENALADEFEGTGRMSRGTRRNLMDAALGYYYCLSTEKKREYRTYKNNLLQRRDQINRRAGRRPTSPPDSCRRQ